MLKTEIEAPPNNMSERALSSKSQRVFISPFYPTLVHFRLVCLFRYDIRETHVPSGLAVIGVVSLYDCCVAGMIRACMCSPFEGVRVVFPDT